MSSLARRHSFRTVPLAVPERKQWGGSGSLGGQIPRSKKRLEELLVEAEARGVEMGMEAARGELDQIRQEAERALQERIAEAHEEARSLREALAALEAEYRAGAGQWLQALEDNLFAVSIAVARQIIDHEIQADPEWVRERVRAATQLLGSHPGRVEVRLHPDDLTTLRAMEEATGPVFDAQNVEWVGDASISRGGCTVDGGERLIDGRIEQAMRMLYQKLSHG